MICPYCGKTTPNAEQCMYCKMPTEFARRTDFQTVGSARNRIEKSVPVPIPRPVPEPRQDGKKQALLAGLMTLCFVAGAGVSWIVHDLVEPKNTEVVIVSGERELPELVLPEQTELPELPTPTGEQIPASTDLQIQMREDNFAEPEPQKPMQETDLTGDAPMAPEKDDIDRRDFRIHFDLNLPEAFTEPGDTDCMPDPILWGEEVPYYYDLREWQFMGWNTEPDGTGIPVPEGEIFDMPIPYNITLFAQWEPKIPGDWD